VVGCEPSRTKTYEKTIYSSTNSSSDLGVASLFALRCLRQQMGLWTFLLTRKLVNFVPLVG